MNRPNQCPFCGGEARVIKHIFSECEPTYGVTCQQCNIQTHQFFTHEEDAIKRWNTRSKIAEQNERNEQNEGHWIPYLPEYGDMFKCSECEHIVRLAYKPPMGVCPYTFCPICGSHMAQA